MKNYFRKYFCTLQIHIKKSCIGYSLYSNGLGFLPLKFIKIDHMRGYLSCSEHALASTLVLL